VNAPRSVIYEALLDPDAIAEWRVPDDMSSRVLESEPPSCGSFRVSLR
jgi:uncharacterized protein YndB with AHSA1/START domain